MEGEQPTIAESEPVAPAIAPEQEVETEDTEKPRDLQQPDEGQAEPEADGEEDDSIEIEWDDGNKYRIPKALEAGILKNKDYTTKTQAVAERAKALESREVEINQRLQATEAELDARANVRAISTELERFKDYDWNAYQAHYQTDPMGADQAWNYVAHLRNQKTELESTLGKATQERTEKAQQDLAKRVQKTLSEAPKIIPGWKAEAANDTIKELVTFAQSEGIPDQVLEANWSPQLLKLLHRARVGTLAMQKQATAAPKPAQPPPTLVPLEKVAGKSSPGASKSISDLAKAGDMEAYVAARKAGRVR